VIPATPLELVPAIDILGGKVVRLRQGKYDQVTVYGEDPAAQAREFAAAGARRIHIVDLDGARDGAPGNLGVIERIVQDVGTAVQVGGGVRTHESIQRWRDVGVSRVVLGTKAAVDAPFLEAAAKAWPGGIIVGVDAKDGEVMVRGWTEGAGIRATDLAQQADGLGVAALLFTNVSHDGTGEGPDVDGTSALQGLVRATVIASGGIGAVSHLVALQRAGVREAVCGRALYDGAFTYAEARTALKEACSPSA
jgi:phosphoribosylformimino-5-aminoimidazole carboxamide ribotide isomerase